MALLGLWTGVVVGFLAGLLAPACARPDPAPPAAVEPAAVPPALSPIELPFRYTPGQIEVEVAVNGRPPIWCIVDSGSDYSILDEEVARSFGIADVPAGERAWAAGVDYAMGPALLRGLRVRVMRLENFRRQGRAIRGLVGHELFDRWVVTVDFQRERLVLTEPAEFRAPTGAARVPFEFSGHLPVVDARLDLEGKGSVPLRVMVDTGAQAAMILRYSFASRHGLYARAGEAKTTGSVDRVTARFVPIPVRGVRLARWTFAIPKVEAYADGAGAGGGTDSDGLIGNALLDQFRVTFEYANRVLWMEPVALEATTRAD